MTQPAGVFIVFFLVVAGMAGMAVGVMFGRRGPIGSCDGGGASAGGAACVCGGQADRCQMIVGAPPATEESGPWGLQTVTRDGDLRRIG